MREKLTILLEHTKSPRIPQGYFSIPKDSGQLQLLSIQDLDEAQIQFCRYISRNGLSGSNLTELSGLVVDENGYSKCKVKFSGDLFMVEPKFILLDELDIKAS